MYLGYFGWVRLVVMEILRAIPRLGLLSQASNQNEIKRDRAPMLARGEGRVPTWGFPMTKTLKVTKALQ
jgi:hypothetical protein